MTRSGSVMAGATAGLLFAGAWADYPELVMLGFTGLGALLTATAWLFVRPQLTAEREVRPRRVFEGSTARGLLTVRNVGRRRSPPLVAIETIGEHRIAVRIPALAGGLGYEVGYPLPTARRGRYLVPPLVLGQSDPLRLLHRGRALGAGLVLHVYPCVHSLTMAKAGGPRDAEGPTASGAPPGGVAFHSLREYVIGDDWRLIHWGATARTGTLMARQLAIPDEPRQLVLLDTSAAPYTATLFEDAVRVAASFCVAAEQAGLPVQLRTTGQATVGARWSGANWGSDLNSALELLSVVDSDSTDQGLAALLDTVRDVVSADHGVALVVVTGRVDAHQAELLTHVRPQFLSVSLAQLITAQSAPTTRPRGVLAIAAPTSVEFATSWNRLVLR